MDSVEVKISDGLLRAIDDSQEYGIGTIEINPLLCGFVVGHYQIGVSLVNDLDFLDQ
jgi:hypothetical protein